MEKALRKSESIFARYYLNDAFNDILFDFELRSDIKIGQDFTVVSEILHWYIFCDSCPHGHMTVNEYNIRRY